MYTERLSEKLALVATVDPDSYSANTYYTDDIDVRLFRRVMFVVAVGDMATGATVDFSVVEGASASPTTAMSPAKAITQLTKAGTDNDKQAIVEVMAEECAVGTRYIRGKLVTATDASDVCVIALADVGRYKPENGYDLASVDEIVA